MGFTISHRILFELNVWHHFFLNKGKRQDGEWEVRFEAITDPAERLKVLSRYDVHRFMEIQPTPSCLQALKAHQLTLKKTNTGLIVGVKEDEDGDEPFIPFDAGMKLTFQLNVRDPEFFNYSDFPMNSLETGQSVYYFHNHSAEETDFRLERTPDDDTVPGVGHPYMGERDKLPLLPHLYNYQFDDRDKEAEIIIEALHSGDEVFRDRIDSKNNVLVHQMDWRHLPAKAYRKTVISDVTEEEAFYLNKGHIRRHTLAIVEIFGRKGGDDYALLDSNGGLLDARRFEVRINNRNTRWKYFTKDTGWFEVADTVIPLTHSGYVEVFEEHHPDIPLPNPNTRMIDYDEGNNQAVSRTYLDGNIFN